MENQSLDAPCYILINGKPVKTTFKQLVIFAKNDHYPEFREEDGKLYWTTVLSTPTLREKFFSYFYPMYKLFKHNQTPPPPHKPTKCN